MEGVLIPDTDSAMSKETAIFRYDGPAVRDHSMDVADLAPALISLSDIIKTANRTVNGPEYNIKVFISVNSEQKCFEVTIEAVQSVYQSARSLLFNRDVVAAKELLEWIFLVTGVGGGSVYGIYKWLGRNKTKTGDLEIESDGDRVILKDKNTNESQSVSGAVYDIASAPETQKSIDGLLNPLQKDGYETLQIERKNGMMGEITSDEANNIADLDRGLLGNKQSVNQTRLRANVRVKKPDLLTKSQWTVVHDRNINVKIEDKEWLERFLKGEILIPAGTYLDVDMRIEIPLDDANMPIEGEQRYFIEKVHQVILPGSDQTSLFDQQ